MNFNKLLAIGEVFTIKYTVEKSDTADSQGNKGVRVLSTPALLRYVEQGSSTGVFERLPEGYRPVGTYIELHHVGATPIGGVIEVISEVSSIVDRKITYTFKVFHQDKTIAYGKYEQRIVVLQEFLKKSKAI